MKVKVLNRKVSWTAQPFEINDSWEWGKVLKLRKNEGELEALVMITNGLRNGHCEWIKNASVEVI